jgi:hypothetical protein
VPAVTEACRSLGIHLDVIGRAFGTATSKPEGILPKYDLVFAKARCALEAMAVGCAVVLCDFAGAGPMVRADTFGELQKLNFGAGTLTRPLRPELIVAEIEKYSAADAKVVSERVRQDAGLSSAVMEWIELYEEVCRDFAPIENQHVREFALLADYLQTSGYEARILWEKKQLNPYLRLPLVGGWLNRFLDRVKVKP